MMIGIYIILGLILYMILRDKEFYREDRKENCINCGREVDYNSLICPHCCEELKKVCGNCGKYIDSSWRSCPFCGKVNYNNIGGKI